MNSAVQIGPLALLVAVLAYVLKRWWDGSNALHLHRSGLYADFLFRCQKMLDAHARFDDQKLAANERHEAFSRMAERLSEFVLYASPNARSAWNEFIRLSNHMNNRENNGADEDEIAPLRTDLAAAVQKMAEVFRADLFGLSPRYHLERWVFQQKCRRAKGMSTGANFLNKSDEGKH